jgi:acetyl-CoA synthetase
MIAPIPCITPIKPACATLPLCGIMAKVLNEDGTETKVGEKGYLCITKPWPSMIKDVWGDNERFKKTYFGDIVYKGKEINFSGDGAIIDENNYITIVGRVDDVINKSGHRLGTAEIEDSINFCTLVSSCSVVSTKHEISGEAIFAFVVLKNESTQNKEEHKNIKQEINKEIKQRIGAIAICDEIVFVSDIPKTRSGKNMRRLLRAIARGENVSGDISTLENPAIIKEIQDIVNKK